VIIDKNEMRNRISESSIIEDKNLAEYYSLMAKRYMGIPCRRVLKRVMAKGIERGSALDVGTGPGVFPIFLSKSLPEVRFQGIDLSSMMIEIAKKNAIEKGVVSRIEFKVGSAYSLPCEDHSIDLLLCINTLHHLDRPIEFFNEVARVLKGGGGFVIVDFHRDTSPFLIWFFDVLWRFFFKGHPNAKEGFLESVRSSYTLRECKNFLERSELRDWYLYTRTVEMWIESKRIRN